jgi:glycosyltransferase involved in cell wall biosynthesis
MTEKEIKKGVTILICTYNGANRLEPTLNALLKQKDTDTIPWEVILVDNASTDKTSEVARNIMEKGAVPFILLYESQPGRDNALKKGFEHARYEYVCNVDDDTWVCNNYVGLVWEIMEEHPEIAVCGGQGTGVFETEPPQWLKKFETSLAIGPQGDQAGYVSRERSYLFGACAVYRNSLWHMLKSSGFQFFLSGRKGMKLNSGEDFELCQAWKLAGYKLWYDPRIQFQHFMPANRLTWNYFKQLFRAFGRSDLITQQYFKVQGLYSQRKSYFLDNYIRYVLYESYLLLKKLPSYLTTLLFSRIGSKNVLNMGREWSLFIELLMNRKRYLAIKKALNDAQWMKKLRN